MDVQFQPEFVPRTCSANAQRWALLKPLLRNTDLARDEEVMNGVWRITGLWRRRLSELQGIGWEPADGKKVQYLRNCPPVMVAVRPYPHTCRRSVVCPWCWGRLVVRRVWDSVIRTLRDKGSLYQRGRAEYPYKLVLTASREVESFKTDPELVLFRLVKSLQKNKSALLKVGPGVIQIASVYPVQQGWVTSHRVLIVVPWDRSTTTRTVTKPTLFNLSRQVGLACRYPAGMVYGPADRVKQLLDVRGGFRLVRFAGEFRQAPGDGEDE